MGIGTITLQYQYVSEEKKIYSINSKKKKASYDDLILYEWCNLCVFQKKKRKEKSGFP